jgi:hypothetical protein
MEAVTMASTKQIDLEGKLQNIGSVRIVRAEWQRDESRFVLLRYVVDGQLQPLGLRLDLDKRVILDSVGDPKVNDSIQALVPKILSIVNAERSVAKITTVFH